MLGHAAGNALGVPTEFMGTAAAIAAAFPDGVHDVVREDTPASPWDDDVAMAVPVAEELLQPRPDLARLAGEWVRWMERDGRGIGISTRAALEHLRRFDAPIADAGGRMGNGSVMRTHPVALRFHRDPSALLSATLGIAALTHPDPRALWSTVAVAVALARLVGGHADFLPDVIEALRANEVPAEVLEAVRSVPRTRREELPIEGPASGSAICCMQVALWTAWHEPALEPALTWLAGAGGDTDTNAAVAGALLGARLGAGAIPRRWVEAVPRWEYLGELGERLVG